MPTEVEATPPQAEGSAGTSRTLYCLNVKLCIKAERREEFLTCIAANKQGTLSTEPLAVTYLFGEDAATPNTFHFFEQYEGREGFEAHTKTCAAMAIERAICRGLCSSRHSGVAPF